MKIEGFGNKKINIYSVENTEDLLLVTFKHKRETYYGICNNDGECVVPFNIEPLTVFATDDKLDYCFTRKNKSYHFSKRKAFEFKLVNKYIGSEETKLELVNTVNDKYWFLKIDKTNETIYSLYDVINQKLITPAFDDITFQEEKNPEVLALVERCLIVKDKENDEDIYLGSILAYINKDGKYVTPFYCPDNDTHYDTRNLNYNDYNYTQFKRIVDGIAATLYQKYLDESKRVDDILQAMYNNRYSEYEIMPEPKKGKILEFKRSDKNET